MYNNRKRYNHNHPKTKTMSNHGNPNHGTPKIKQAENLAAFFSDWSNLLTPSSAAETKTETALGPRQPFSPHPLADLPLPLPSGRTLRRCNTFTNANSNDEGGGGGGTSSTDDGDGDDGARESLAMNFLRSSSLTLHEHEHQPTHQNGPSHQSQRQRTTATGRNGNGITATATVSKRSPLCTRAVLHEKTSARSGGGGGGSGIGILPLPFARSAVQQQQLSSTSASNSSSRMTSPPLSRDHQQGPPGHIHPPSLCRALPSEGQRPPSSWRCHYHSHHQSESERGEGNMNMIYVPQPQPAAEAEAPDTDDVPPAAAATSPDPDPESNTALTMTATKKRRMSANYAQSHLYPYQMQMQMQESSFFQGWNEERSSAFASMPNTHKDKEEASSTDKEAGKKPGPYPQKGGDPNPINVNDTIIRNNPHPYLHPHFQVFSPSFSPAHEQFHHFHSPQKHEHPDNNLLPLAAPYSRVRRQFGNEHYMSPVTVRPTPAEAAHSKKDPPPSAVATEEAKMKATRDDGTKDLVHAEFPPTFPNLSVKGVCTSTSSQCNAWDRKFNELVSLRTAFYKIRDCSVTLFPSIICSFLIPFFSLILSSNMAIVMCHRLMHQIPNLGYG
jgi:hypothetical protein